MTSRLHPLATVRAVVVFLVLCFTTIVAMLVGTVFGALTGRIRTRRRVRPSLQSTYA